MSEDFDKEAERKRLREKYEAEREDREATERMSDLLLKGATMTNKHCEVCGSPIFRYQGQEFCPSCQEERGGAEAAQEGGQATAEGSAAGEGAGEGSQSTGEAQPTTEGGSEVESWMGESASPATGEDKPEAAQPATGAAQPTGTATGDAGASAAAGSLDEAQAALVRTLTSLARRAEQTDDPRQAKELLSAAREAAETLARLRGR